jgi:hypothetical protein
MGRTPTIRRAARPRRPGAGLAPSARKEYVRAMSITARFALLRTSSSRFAGALALGALGVVAAGPSGCAESDTAQTSTTSTGTATTTTGTATGTGGAGGATTTTTASGGAGGASTTTTGTGGATTTTTPTGEGGAGGATTTTTGEGGAGGAPAPVWPDCTTQPGGSATKTIPQIWDANPPKQTKTGYWLPGVYVTAISADGCVAGKECQIFLQQDETYADLAAGAKHAIKLFASKNTSSHFVGVKVGDKLDVFASAWRSNLNGANELMLDVNLAYPGCWNKVGSGAVAPVKATLADLTIAAYEETLGPLFVEVDLVSGKPTSNTELFGLWPTGAFPDGGPDSFVDLSFYFLPGQAFSGLTLGKLHDFTSIMGVFGEVIIGGQTKYRTLYPRTMADVVIGKVH